MTLDPERQKLVERYAAYALRVASSLTSDEELQRDSFVTLCKAAERWEPERGPFKRYLRYRVRRDTINRIERGAHERPAAVKTPLRGDVEAPRADDLLSDFLDSLNPILRPVAELVTARYTAREIADRLGLTYEAARSRVTRVKRLCMEYINDED